MNRPPYDEAERRVAAWLLALVLLLWGYLLAFALLIS